MKPLIFSILVFTTINLQAQNNQELYEILEANPDSIGIYQAIVRLKLFNSPDTAKKVIQKGLLVAQRNGFTKAEADLNSKYGIWHDVHGGNSDSVFHYFTEAKNIYRKINEMEGYADALNNIAYAYSRRSKSKEALPMLQRAVSIYDSLGTTTKSMSTLLNIAIIYQSNEELDKAMERYNRIIDFHGRDTINGGNYKAFSNVATIYNRQEKYDSAIALFEKLTAYSEGINDYRALGVFYNNFSTTYLKKGQYGKALEQIAKSYQHKLQLKDSVGMVSTLNTTASIYSDMGKYKKSIESAETALTINERAGIPKDQGELLKLLAETNQLSGQFQQSALYYTRYITFKDSLDKAQQKVEIAEIMEKYESVQRQQEITQLQFDNQKSENERNIFILVAAIVVVVSILLFALLRSKSKSNRIVTKSLIEKETLLKEIHHRVKNNLQIISSLLSLQSRYIEDEKAQAAVNEGQNRVKSMALIHQKLYQNNNLLGVEIIDYIKNLTATLKDAYGIESDRISIDYELEDLKIDVDTIIPIGLILNELISNSFKYAFPDNREGNLKIILRKLDDALELRVKDDGVGSEREVEKSNSFGMRMIHSLAMKLEAEVNFDFKKGADASVLISSFKLV